MYQIILIVHVLLGLSVVSLVLIQQGKGADAGAAFGSASSGSVFGAQGASSFLSRMTAILVAFFFSTSLGLAVLGSYQEGEINLMDAPEVEDVFEDIPFVDDNDTPVIETAPVIKDIPVATSDISDVVPETEVAVE